MDTAALLQTVEHETARRSRNGPCCGCTAWAPTATTSRRWCRSFVRRRDWPALRFVFPHAPQRAVTINGGMRMRAWYDIRDADLANRADAQGVEESIAQVEALIAREAARGVPASRADPRRLLAGRRHRAGRGHCVVANRWAA